MGLLGRFGFQRPPWITASFLLGATTSLPGLTEVRDLSVQWTGSSATDPLGVFLSAWDSGRWRALTSPANDPITWATADKTELRRPQAKRLRPLGPRRRGAGRQGSSVPFHGLAAASTLTVLVSVVNPAFVALIAYGPA
jgi:hypothetical protein